MVLVRQSEIVILSLSGEAGSVVVPAGAGLVTSSPGVPVQVVGEAVPAAGGEVDQAFHLGDGDVDESGIGWRGVVGAGG